LSQFEIRGVISIDKLKQSKLVIYWRCNKVHTEEARSSVLRSFASPKSPVHATQDNLLLKKEKI
jgi:hypothetical protein